MKLEIRTAAFDQAGTGKLAGYAAVYAPAQSEDLGGFIEEIAPGAFDSSLASNRDVRALWNHDSSQPLARTSNGSLALSSDSRGLKVEINLPEGVSYANDLRELVRQGVVNQMSFGFMVPPGGDSWEKRGDKTVRTLNRIDLHEISAVSIPAYPDTTVALRSLRAVEFETERARWLSESGHRAASVLDSMAKGGYRMKEIVEKLKGLAEKREALVKEIRELGAEDAAKLEELKTQAAELDAQIAEIEAKAGEPSENNEEQNALPAGEVRAQLDETGNKIAKLLEDLNKKTTKRSKPEMGAANFVKDLNDKQWHKDRALALRGWFMAGQGKDTDEQKAAAQRVGVNIRSRDLNFRLFETAPKTMAELEKRGTATQVIGTGSLGGNLVPTILQNALEKALLYYNPLRQYANVVRTATGETMAMPFNDDTSNKGELLAEGSAITVLDTTFTQVSLGAYTFSSKALKVSWQLLEDNVIDLESYVADALAERIGRILADYSATGTGSSQPEGIANASTGKTTASATAITSAEILDLIHSVDLAYRQSPNCALVMHDSVWLYVRKLVDGNSLPLFQESFRVPGEIRVHGYPVIIHNSMASSVATTNKTMVFGDLSKFVIRDVSDIRIQRLDELYAANGTVGFLGWFRSDSKIAHSGALKKMVQA